MAKIKSIHGYAGQYKEIANRIKNERDDEALDIAAQPRCKAISALSPHSSGASQPLEQVNFYKGIIYGYIEPSTCR